MNNNDPLGLLLAIIFDIAKIIFLIWIFIGLF